MLFRLLFVIRNGREYVRWDNNFKMKQNYEGELGLRLMGSGGECFNYQTLGCSWQVRTENEGACQKPPKMGARGFWPS